MTAFVHGRNQTWGYLLYFKIIKLFLKTIFWGLVPGARTPANLMELKTGAGEGEKHTEKTDVQWPGPETHRRGE